ncbi:glycosyltransferase [Microbacterium arborescens]|uniref:glycosyltransferase n=1 Tax=Microbacterium arborescens TaxID=33883 RepID=UPI0027D8E716|nr:glycosyltransferase [Microbacterium arborescens]
MTNNAAPYRMPVWESLAENVDLRVRLLQGDEELLSAGRRSADWTVSSARSSGLDISTLRTVRVGRGERLYYGLREPACRLVNGCDAVLLGAWESPACWQLSAAARRFGVRRVGFYESTRMSQRHHNGPVALARGKFFRNLDAVVVPGPAAADALRDLGVHDSRIFEGFNAVDVESFASVAQSAPVDAGHRFLYVGQLIDRKNVDSLIRAFARVFLSGDKLTIVGAGPERRHLEAVARDLQVAEDVDFLGALPYSALPDQMARHHTLVLPSLEEVWGLVVNEALAAGRHAVVSARAGVAASVEGMRGVYISSPDVAGLSQALTRSRGAWQDPILDHEILSQTPRQFGQTFHRALIR